MYHAATPRRVFPDEILTQSQPKEVRGCLPFCLEVASKMAVSRRTSVFALTIALLGCSQALRPAGRTTVARQPHLSLSRRQLATAATAAAVSSLHMPGGWRASAASNLKKKRALQPELVQILRVKESTGQESRLISTGKFKDLQRLNIKRAIGMMLDNSDVRGCESNPGLGSH